MAFTFSLCISFKIFDTGLDTFGRNNEKIKKAIFTCQKTIINLWATK